ncbi:MAG: cell surface protein SprA [Bacteroidetes bacterium CG12_big_fil_rev_8_21_14_0_65_60_17]|nr:MAG: cell surface protein SprA [Bacteroidetes bacterium CG12_big_fil_rev_8_21_14_0_65_60_17]
MPDTPVRTDYPHGGSSRTRSVLTGIVALFIVSMVLVSAASTHSDVQLLRSEALFFTRSDTDSVRVSLTEPIPDSLIADSIVLVFPDSGRVMQYIRRWQGELPSSSVFPRDTRPFFVPMGRVWRHEIEFDSTALAYRPKEKVGETEVRFPIYLDFDRYRDARLGYDLDQNWRTLIVARERARQRQNRGGVGINVVVPGGRQSAFTTIFGKPEVDLRVNGTADIAAGFDYLKNDQQVSVTGRSAQLDPQFRQDLSLGITGTIGDKLRINVKYDSSNQFDFQNQLRLEYTGYEDEIIQSIEAGNVNLQTSSSLIRGGQSLFGIKSELQLGGIRLTTVMSQQEGQANSLDIDGGSESTEFDLQPTDYDEAVHFFLGYYFRNRWEDALSDPPNIRVANNFERITEIEVWKLMPTQPEEENVRQAVAVVDLGEPRELLDQANQFTAAILPSPDRDQYDYSDGGEVDTEFRDGNASPSSYLENVKDMSASDFQVGKFKRLQEGRDYTIDEVLGYVSLRQRIQESEALAVSFRYRAAGQTFTIGDFSTDTGGSDGGQNEAKIVLKLLRPVQMRQPALEAGFNPAAWYLEMRNIYRLPGSGIQPEDFKLQVFYEPPGQVASKTLPGAGGTQTALQIMGLDRVNENAALSPDDQFDFLVNYTILPGEGRLIFPFLEPFAGRIDQVIQAGPGSPEAKQQVSDLLAYDNLYTQKKANALRDTQHNVYAIRGSYKGSVKAFYDLRAFSGVVPGSIRVTSGGTPLAEGTDFVADYSGTGSVQIVNPAFLTAGRDINIEFEQNSFFNVQKKTLLGLRAEYERSEKLSLGSTVMSLKEKSPIDKFRIGEEPISNTIWGVDGAIRLEPRWMTQTIDRIPLLQTREPSSIQLSGEFAQLRPNHTETVAFSRTRDNLRGQGRDFARDELNGTSYIDDFEGFENTFPLTQPGSWSLASAPDSIGVIDRFGITRSSLNDSLRTAWRGAFGWYRVNANILREVPAIAQNVDAIRIFRIDEVFPNRDTRAEIDPTLETFDLYFNPHMRGPYNYTQELRRFLDNPKDTWGGMVQRLPDGFTDFSLKNIDFVEFIFQAFPENTSNDPGRDAKLYLDLGTISEDVLPDGRLNNEDGLSTSNISEAGFQEWGRSPTGTQNNVVDLDDGTNRTEDLGLDGLSSVNAADYPDFATEQVHFSDFLESLDQNDPDPRYRAEVARAFADPSGDDYHYFGNSQYFDNPEFFPDRATFQQRFTRYFSGHELNAFETQNKLATNTSVRRGNSRFPDSEDLNRNSTVDTENSYFQYEIPLSRRALDSLAVPAQVDDFVVGEIKGEDGGSTGWFQVRIPVQQFTRRVGDIQDFTKMESIRIWTTGHEVPITLRLASLELVGSQWQKSDRITLEHDTPFDTTFSETRLTVSSINNEENADIYAPPLGAVVSQSRLASGLAQNAREQSLVLRVENLLPGSQRGIFKTQANNLDLLKYSNLRMFVHAHGILADGRELATLPVEEARSKARLFVRIGANESNDYYEYEQPLTPSSETAGSPEVLWQTSTDFQGMIQDLGSMNIELGALNQLKVARDDAAFPLDSVFYNALGDTLRSSAVPDASLFAPPGTRLGIKGTPSLGKVNTIVIGIRNPADSTSTAFEDILQDITIWVNELRVAGYDETNGWAGLATADIKLADVGRVKANINRQTDGFGSLSSSLGERDQTDVDNWSVTTELNANKLIPDRYGWRLPVNIQVQSNTATPRFSPTRGDVRLDEILSQIDGREDLTPEERNDLKQNALESAQTHTFNRSLSTRLSKTNSRSRLLRNTMDGVTLSLSQARSDGRSPTQSLNDSWRWSQTTSYRFSTRKVKTVRPLFFLDPVPVLGLLGDLNLNYMPSNITTSASFSRSFTQSRERPRVSPTDTVSTPLDVRFPTRENHTFTTKRDFGFQYNPFTFLNFSFDQSTNQNLNAAGVDTTFSVVLSDTTFRGVSIEDALASGLIDSTQAQSAFETTRLDVVNGTSVIGDFLGGSASPRTERHSQQVTASFRPRLQRIRFLNWLQLQDISYGAQYDWQNGAVGRNTGASIRNSVTARSGVSIRFQELFRKISYYEELENAQKKYVSARQAQRRRKEQERARSNHAGEEDEETSAQRQNALKDDEDDLGVGDRVKSVGRRTVLAVTGVRDFNISYTGTRSSQSSNVGTPVLDENGNVVDVSAKYGFFDALRGNGPSLGYRFGLDRQIDISQRLIDPSLQVSDQLTDNDRFQGRTTLNPSQALTINLNWNLEFQNGKTFTFQPQIDNATQAFLGVDTTLTEQGTNKASVWAFGSDYLDLFNAQLRAFSEDLAATGEDDPVIVPDANGDGRVVLTNSSVVQDFRTAYIRNQGTVDNKNLVPFPRPSWTVSYSGLGKFPVLRRLVQNASVRHGYSADYSSDFRTNTSFTSNDTLNTVDLGGRRIQSRIEPFQAGNIRVNERFSPMVGLDLSWKRQIQTTINWNKSNAFSLSTANFEVSESRTNEVSMTFGYQKTGLKLPFMSGKRLENRLSFNLTLSRSNTSDERLRLRRALEQALGDPDFVPSDALQGDNISLVTAHTRTSVTPKLAYQFSNRVSADFTLKYEKFDSEDSRQPSSVNINGAFNIRVSISN